jgi:hypothetical protein
MSGSQAAARANCRGAGRGEQHDVTGFVGREVADEGVEVVGAVDVHEAPLTGEDAGRARHPLGELTARQRPQPPVPAPHVHGIRGVRCRPPAQGRTRP